MEGAPSPMVRTLLDARPMDIESIVQRHTHEYVFYGSGKAALRDGASAIADPGENVLLPSYLPDAVDQPFRELGLEPRYYSVTQELEPDLPDVVDRADERTVAVMTVNYFGFPQPGLDSITAVANERGWYHIDDNAHGALSVTDGVLLGTNGDIGITCLWKLLPVPNGALLYVNDETITSRFERSNLAGTANRFDARDYRYILKSIAKTVLQSNELVKESFDWYVERNGISENGTNPEARYDASKTPFSKLTSRIIGDLDPADIRNRRRANFDAWLRVFESQDDVHVLYDELPDGICPQVFPIRTTRPKLLLETLDQWEVSGVHTWPRLSPQVRTDTAYENARNLAREVVVLPVHQQIEPESIESLDGRIEV